VDTKFSTASTLFIARRTSGLRGCQDVCKSACLRGHWQAHARCALARSWDKLGLQGWC
jgi:hypothetical protein